MFSATEPLASSPIATSGTGKLVSSTAALSQRAQTIGGAAYREKLVGSTAALTQGEQTLLGSSATAREISATASVLQGAQFIVGISSVGKIVYGEADLLQEAQTVEGQSLFTRIVSGSGALFQEAQEVFAICYAVQIKTGTAFLIQAAQDASGTGTRLKTITATADLVTAAQTIQGAATRIRFLFGSGDLVSAAQTLYGSEVSPIWIKTRIAPINLYEVSRKITSEPYSTTNKYLTIYQVPGYKEIGSDGSIREVDITGIITAMSAVTVEGTPQPISLIVIRLLEEDFEIFPIMPSYVVTRGVENILPLRDFNLVTGDIIQVKSLGAGYVTINMSILLNTQTYYEVT